MKDLLRSNLNHNPINAVRMSAPRVGRRDRKGRPASVSILSAFFVEFSSIVKAGTVVTPEIQLFTVCSQFIHSLFTVCSQFIHIYSPQYYHQINQQLNPPIGVELRSPLILIFGQATCTTLTRGQPLFHVLTSAENGNQKEWTAAKWKRRGSNNLGAQNESGWWIVNIIIQLCSRNILYES